jgi:hypothetical protein
MICASWRTNHAPRRRRSAEPSYAPLEAGETLNPNDIARLIIRDHTVLAEQTGYIWEYNHRFWETTTRTRIAAYAMAYDTHRETKARRRSEAADYVITFCHTKKIQWRQVAPYEIPVWNGVVNLGPANPASHQKQDFLETVSADRVHWGAAVSDVAGCPEPLLGRGRGLRAQGGRAAGILRVLPDDPRALQKGADARRRVRLRQVPDTSGAPDAGRRRQYLSRTRRAHG